jgi:hypothetical protein
MGVDFLPILIFLGSICIVGLNSFKFSEKSIFFFLVIFSLLIIVSSFSRLYLFHQYDDFSNYYEHYHSWSKFSDVLPYLEYDPLFYLVLYLVYFFLGSISPASLYAVFNIFYFLIFYLTSRRLIKSNNEILFIFLTISSPFFIIFSGQFVRQALSLCLVLYALTYQKKMHRLLILILATSIHLSSILALPSIFIERLNTKHAISTFTLLIVLAYFFPIDQSFVSLFTTGDYLFSKVEYWINDDLKEAGMVYKWVPTVIATFLIVKLSALCLRRNEVFFKVELSGYAARYTWLLCLFTVIGYWGRYLNAFPMRFGLWAILFSNIPIFFINSNFSKIVYVVGIFFVYIIALMMLHGQNSDSFEYIYRFVFFPLASR